MAAVGTYLQVGGFWKVTQIEGHPQRPNNEEAGPIRVTDGLADSSTGKRLWTQGHAERVGRLCARTSTDLHLADEGN